MGRGFYHPPTRNHSTNASTVVSSWGEGTPRQTCDRVHFTLDEVLCEDTGEHTFTKVYYIEQLQNGNRRFGSMSTPATFEMTDNLYRSLGSPTEEETINLAAVRSMYYPVTKRKP